MSETQQAPGGASRGASLKKVTDNLVEIAVVALASAVIYHEVRLGVIESNRFTRADWQQQALPISEGVQELLVNQSALMVRIDSMLTRQRENSEDIDALENAIMNLKGK